jgi:hypothetical protein
MANFTKILNSPYYDSVSPRIKDLVKAMTSEAILYFESTYKDQIRRVLKDSMATPQQQIETIEGIVNNTLHKPKATRRIRAIAKGCISENQASQLPEEDIDTTPSYHSVREVMLLIESNMESIQTEPLFAARDFRLSHLIAYLRVRADLRAADDERRWSRQVHNALSGWNIGECPILRSTVKGYYKLRQP